MLANDTDADGDALTASVVAQPAHGTVTLAPTGGFTYTPTAGWSGTDTFTYRAYDGEAYSNTALATINVTQSTYRWPTPTGRCPRRWRRSWRPMARQGTTSVVLSPSSGDTMVVGAQVRHGRRERIPGLGLCLHALRHDLDPAGQAHRPRR